MIARVIKIGNSQGLRIPKPILDQTGILDDVEIEVKKTKSSFDLLKMFVRVGMPLSKLWAKRVMTNR
ncbi:MAG: hypothetical protein ABIK92_16490 [Pseudomonadota bacterium]